MKPRRATFWRILLLVFESIGTFPVVIVVSFVYPFWHFKKRLRELVDEDKAAQEESL